MGKIRYTKNELKRQRDALRRFERYLPTLQLKKQQLQAEVRRVEGLVEKNRAAEESLRGRLAPWISLFSEPVRLDRYLSVRAIRAGEGNIAGVAIPVLGEVAVERTIPDLFATPVWIDEGLRVLEELLRLGAERMFLAEQLRRLSDELRVTSQRVNLFEKVKIPECREHIRVIRIFLGDQMAAAVARAKIAKSRVGAWMEKA